jgi:hypothetical protein
MALAALGCSGRVDTAQVSATGGGAARANTTGGAISSGTTGGSAGVAQTTSTIGSVTGGTGTGGISNTGGTTGSGGSAATGGTTACGTAICAPNRCGSILDRCDDSIDCGSCTVGTCDGGTTADSGPCCTPLSCEQVGAGQVSSVNDGIKFTLSCFQGDGCGNLMQCWCSWG